MAFLIQNKLVLVTEKEFFQDKIFIKNPLGFKKALYPIYFLHNNLLFIKGKLFRYICKKLVTKGYIVGIHFGNNFDLAQDLDVNIASFVLCPEGISTTSPSVLNLSSRDFVPRHYSEMNSKVSDKAVDFICVANISKNKNLEAFLRSLYEFKFTGKGILVVPTHSGENAKQYDINIVKAYLDMPEEFRTRVTFIRLSKELGFRGIEGPALSILMNSAKYIVLPSDSEGEPRVITEGLLSNCIALIPAHQKNHLPPSYGPFVKRYGDYLELVQILNSQNEIKFDNLEIQNELSQKNKMAQAVLENFLLLKFSLEIKIPVNMDRILPGHVNSTFSWSSKYKLSPNIEIFQFFQLYKFYLLAK